MIFLQGVPSPSVGSSRTDLPGSNIVINKLEKMGMGEARGESGTIWDEMRMI